MLRPYSCDAYQSSQNAIGRTSRIEHAIATHAGLALISLIYLIGTIEFDKFICPVEIIS